MNTPITFANLTPEQFSGLLKQAVDKRGEDYVYPYHHKQSDGACRYRYRGRPSCIIGEVIHAIDPTARPEEGTAASEVLVKLGVNYTSVLEAADSAQLVQDSYASWGEAYDAAVKEIAAHSKK